MEKLTLSHPFFNVQPPTSMAAREYTDNIGHTLLHSFPLEHFAIYKPAKNFKNPQWFIQKLVNW